MSNHKGGGPAFPRPNSLDSRQECDWGHSGMTLRDWFAGQAAVGLASSLSDSAGYAKTVEAIALKAYRIADAMLVAREDSDF